MNRTDADETMHIVGSSASGSDTPSIFSTISAWKVNLLFFGLLIAIVLAYFFWQVQHAHQVFLGYVHERSSILVRVIERNAENAVMSQAAIEGIMETFMGNSARFVDYLDSIESFSDAELGSFALEAGLSGICIINEDKSFHSGPEQWLEKKYMNCKADEKNLIFLPSAHLYLLSYPKFDTKGCIILGLSAIEIENLRRQTGLSHLLKKLSGLGGILYVRVEKEKNLTPKVNNEKMLPFPSPPPSFSGSSPPFSDVRIYINESEKLAEARLPFGSEVLVTGIDASRFFHRVSNLWIEFFVFSAILGCLGIIFSYLLYRYQKIHMKKITDYERALAQQREDAALGRSAASIAHEIKNPLNAISMGLQRFQIEADDILSDEYNQLITSMLSAVGRTNSIVNNIRQFAHPIKPVKRPVSLRTIIEHTTILYKIRCDDAGIELNLNFEDDGNVEADRFLLEQMIENLVKNAVEAQENGGYLNISLKRKKAEICLSMENPGFSTDEGDENTILQPYFTTKSRGTGLGLPIASKIARTHGGRLEATTPSAGILRILVFLPC
ncbi:ATP-binding protein [Desulfobacterales bacterium HSG16]|nr:ATP-binding protein [Desulfobacterales bacterium HSG16]